MKTIQAVGKFVEMWNERKAEIQERYSPMAITNVRPYRIQGDEMNEICTPDCLFDIPIEALSPGPGASLPPIGSFIKCHGKFETCLIIEEIDEEGKWVRVREYPMIEDGR